MYSLKKYLKALIVHFTSPAINTRLESMLQLLSGIGSIPVNYIKVYNYATCGNIHVCLQMCSNDVSDNKLFLSGVPDALDAVAGGRFIGVLVCNETGASSGSNNW